MDFSEFDYRVAKLILHACNGLSGSGWISAMSIASLPKSFFLAFKRTCLPEPLSPVIKTISVGPIFNSTLS